MKLEKLDIRREMKYINGYGTDPVAVYVGVVKFSQTIGNVEIVLTQEQLQEIISVVGNNLIDATKEVAKAMNFSIAEEMNNGAKLISKA